jgi:type III restriction enzyme
MGITLDGRFRASNLTLKRLVIFAFDLQDYQVFGGPAGWTPTHSISRPCRRVARLPSRLVLAIRSVRIAEPVLICPALVATVKSAMKSVFRLARTMRLSKPENQEKLINRVRAVMAARSAQAVQPQLPGAVVEPAVPVDIEGIAIRTSAKFQDLTIDIPRITVTPIDGQSGYLDFNLDLRTVGYQASPDGIYIQHLHDGKSLVLSSWDTGDTELRPEDYLVRSLMDYPDISYDSTSELLYKLAGQTVAHLRSYLPDEDAVENVVRGFLVQLVGLIHAQM